MARITKKTTKVKKTKLSRRAEPEPEVLEEVEGGGLGIDEGIVFTTFALLAGAIYMLFTLLGDRYPDPL